MKNGKCLFRNPGSGECPNYERMKSRFLKRGEWSGCAGCCQMCKERKKCEIACAEVAQIKIEDILEEVLQDGQS